MSDPKVSIVMSSYNHAAYVGRTIESVLEQTFQDFEFLIGDDGSRDATPHVIEQFTDPRIAFIRHPHNRGAAAVTNESILRCRGQYIARINSDDCWPLDKLRYQVEFLDAHPEYDAIFGDVIFVDEAGAPLETRPYPFGQFNRSRGRWLRRFFEYGNCLCHPTLVIRRSCFATLGGYDNRLRQLPDFDMWVRLVKRYAFYVSDRPLAYFRILPGRNTSTPSPENLARHFAENFLIGSRFFDGVDKNLLLDGFADLLIEPELPSDVHSDIEKAFLFFRPLDDVSPVYRVIGLQKLEALMSMPSHREVLKLEYGFDDLAFQRLSGTVDTFTKALRGGAASVSIGTRLPTRASRARHEGAAQTGRAIARRGASGVGRQRTPPSHPMAE